MTPGEAIRHSSENKEDTMKLKATLLACAATVALAGPSLAERELTLGMQDNESSIVYKGAQEFARTLKEVSGGELTVNLFPSSTLGDFKAMVVQLQAGELDMVITGYPDMSYIIPELWR